MKAGLKGYCFEMIITIARLLLMNHVAELNDIKASRQHFFCNDVMFDA